MVSSNLVGAGLLDHAPGKAGAGYTLSYTSTPTRWTLAATPGVQSVSGDRSFFVDETGVIRFEWGGPADGTSTPLE